MLQKIEKKEFNDKLAVILSIILSVIVFLLLYGPYPLNVCNDSWILFQYDGTDIMQHYAGWAQYRISDWGYPLGYANELAYGDGTYITYTDSIPYVALFFKLFNSILPQTFQYFGWFTLGCYILQGVGACLLLKREIRSYVGVLLGDIFFLTAPVLIERTYKHTALSAQWLVLFSIYYYLEYRDKDENAKLPWQMIFLATLTMGLHPYFLPMVMIFVLLIIIEALLRKYSLLRIVGYTVLSVLCPIMSGVLIGAIGNGVKNTRHGYGYFGMNLNSLFNPQSSSGYIWSQVLPQRGQAYSTYEGFNYLGLGMLLMAVVCLVLFVVAFIREAYYRETFFKGIKRNIAFILCMAFMVLFAVTNIVTWDNTSILRISLPVELVETASIFRASGRMFWPVYYLIILKLICYLNNNVRGKLGIVLLGILLVVQVYDMREVYQIRYERMKELYAKSTILDDEILKEVPEKEVLVVAGSENFEIERVLAVWAAHHNMGVAYSVANTGEYKNAEQYTNWFEETMYEGIMREDVMYVTFDEDVARLWREALVDDVYTEYKRGFYYFFYKE